MSELTELRDELIYARNLLEDITPMEVLSGGYAKIKKFWAMYPCSHLSVTEFVHQIYSATRDQPAEYGGHAVCNLCGDTINLDDVPEIAVRRQG